ncbi:MAG: hypothetical protein AAFQ86_16750 [Bacteroidota bacterium]
MDLIITNQIDDNPFSPYTTGWSNLSACGGCVEVQTSKQALWDEGLMIERVWSLDAPSSNPRALRDIIVSDNNLATSATCDALNPLVSPTQAELYDGDLWSPENKTQLSP